MLLLAVDTSGKNGSLALVRTTPLKPKAGLNGAPTSIPTSPNTYHLNDPTQAKSGLEWGTQSPSFDLLELTPLVGRMYSAQIIPELQNALARQNLKKRGDFTPDFCAVFHAVDRKLTSFMEVGSVSKQDTTAA